MKTEFDKGERKMQKTNKGTFKAALKEYKASKAAVDNLEERINRKDRALCANYGHDGLSWTMENDADFESVLVELEKYVESTGLQEQVNDARKKFQEAEQGFARVAVGLMPNAYAGERAALVDKVERDYSTLQKVIDLALQLDVRTIA